MTVIIEHVRLASRTIKESSGLSYNEFTLLYLLLDSSEPLSAETLADFLMIRKETASDLLLRMEDKHLIVKTPDDGDRRVMRCVLSRTGRSLTARSSAEVESALSKRVSPFDGRRATAPTHLERDVSHLQFSTSPSPVSHSRYRIVRTPVRTRLFRLLEGNGRLVEQGGARKRRALAR